MNTYPVLTTMPARQSYFRNPSPFYQGPRWRAALQPVEGATVVVRVRKARPAKETVLARVAVPVTRESKLAQWRAELAKAMGRMTPARAAKLRAKGRSICGCILCQWGATPAATSADHEARRADCERRNVAGAWDDCLFRTWEYANVPSWSRYVPDVKPNNPFRRLK